MNGLRTRAQVKRALAAADRGANPRGASLLIYHRVGARTRDELTVSVDAFRGQLDVLERHDVVPLDTALDRLDRRDHTHSIVLTFDDGFADVYENAWPILRERHLPFTMYLASAYMGRPMVWPASTARGPHGQGMTWAQLEELVDSGLCTLGNHTHTHVRPESLTTQELDHCSAVIESRLGIRPQHFTYPWGIPVPALETELASRFRSSSTGLLGRNGADVDRQRLRRIPVRQSDPTPFFEAKLNGRLWGERAYGVMVGAAKLPRRLLSGGRAGSPG